MKTSRGMSLMTVSRVACPTTTTRPRWLLMVQALLLVRLLLKAMSRPKEAITARADQRARSVHEPQTVVKRCVRFAGRCPDQADGRWLRLLLSSLLMLFVWVGVQPTRVQVVNSRYQARSRHGRPRNQVSQPAQVRVCPFSLCLLLASELKHRAPLQGPQRPWPTVFCCCPCFPPPQSRHSPRHLRVPPFSASLQPRVQQLAAP